MNILLDAPWLDRSGAPLALLRLARHLAKTHRVDLVPARAGDATLLPDFEAAGVRLLEHVAVPGDYDVLLANTLFRVQLLAAVADQMATVLWVHEPALGRRIVAENPPVADVFRRATRIVFVVGHQPAAIYRDFLRPGSWSVVPIGIDLPDVVPARPLRRQGRLDLALVGTLEPRKGQHVALQALDGLADPGIRLALVGGDRRWEDHVGGLRRFLAARPALAAAVDIVGALPPEAAVRRFAEADAALFPSLDDNMPTVLIEALGQGCPVIASALPPIAEAIEDGVTGLLVPPGDAAALGHAIARLRDDRDLAARLSANGVALARDRFGLPAHLARMEAELVRAVRERGVRP